MKQHLIARFPLKIVLLSALILCVGAVPVVAQSQYLDMAPLEFRSHFRRASDEFNQVTVGVQRSVPVAYLLPQVTPDSYFEGMRLIAGMRFGTERTTEIRFRATGIKFEIQKTPWSAGFTLIDYDRTSLEDLQADWLGLSIGPGFDVGRDAYRFVVRGLAAGSFNTYRVGDHFQFDQDIRTFAPVECPGCERTRSGFAYGAQLRTSIILGRRFRALGAWDITWHTADDELRRDVFKVTTSIGIAPRWTVVGTYSYEEISVNVTTITRSGWGVGLRFLTGELLE